MQAISSSETSDDFQKPTQRYISVLSLGTRKLDKLMVALVGHLPSPWRPHNTQNTPFITTAVRTSNPIYIRHVRLFPCDKLTL
jgi:hypothetical protein